MANIKDFQNEWKRYREAVNAANTAYDSEIKRLESYEGEKADEERREATAKRDEAITSAQSEARYRFNQILNRMAAKVDAIEPLAAPSEEGLRVLQLLQLKEKISAREAESAAKLLEGNDSAIRALEELCKKRGGVVPSVSKHMGKRGQAQDALKEFNTAVGYLLQWRGGSRAELIQRRAEEHITRSGSRTPFSAAFAADVDAQVSESDFVMSIVGGHATYDGALLID